MSARLVCSSSSSALRCERSLTVITQARCLRVGERTAPTETIAGKVRRRGAGSAPRTRRSRTTVASAKASRAPRGDPPATTGTACGRRAAARAEPGDLADAVVHVDDHAPAVRQLVGDEHAVGDRVSTRAVKSRSVRTRRSASNRSVTSANVTTTALERALGRPQSSRVLLDPAQLAVLPVDAHEHARARLAVAQRHRARPARRRQRVAQLVDERQALLGPRPHQVAPRAPRMRCALALAETMRRRGRARSAPRRATRPPRGSAARPARDRARRSGRRATAPPSSRRRAPRRCARAPPPPVPETPIR